MAGTIVIFCLAIIAINILQVNSISFIWDVPLSEMTGEPSDYILSPKFKTWNRTEYEIWQLQLYPNGLKSSKSRNSVGLFLVHRTHKKVSVSFEIFVVNQKSSRDTISQENKDKIYTYDLQGWGSKEMTDRKTLEDPEKGFLSNGIVRFGARLETDPIIVQQNTTNPYTWTVQEEELNLASILSPKFTTWYNGKLETWRLRLYPKRGANKDYTALFLVHVGNHTVTCEWSLTIVNKNPGKNEMLMDRTTFRKGVEKWGTSQFMKSARLFNHSEGFVNDKKVIIKVEIPSEDISLNADNNCPVSKVFPSCRSCPKPPVVAEPVTAQRDSDFPPINASLYNLYNNLTVRTPDGLEFSIEKVWAFEPLHTVISEIQNLHILSRDCNRPAG